MREDTPSRRLGRLALCPPDSIHRMCVGTINPHRHRAGIEEPWQCRVAALSKPQIHAHRIEYLGLLLLGGGRRLYHPRRWLALGCLKFCRDDIAGRTRSRSSRWLPLYGRLHSLGFWRQAEVLPHNGMLQQLPGDGFPLSCFYVQL